jgi:hypothetical protein
MNQARTKRPRRGYLAALLQLVMCGCVLPWPMREEYIGRLNGPLLRSNLVEMTLDGAGKWVMPVSKMQSLTSR